MTWVERNQNQIEKIRAYVLDFQNVKPRLFTYFQGGEKTAFPLAPESDRGVALILMFCSLYQNIAEEKLVGVMRGLWDQYGKDLFRLNNLPFQDLQSYFLKQAALKDWPLRIKAAGILRSVCDFFFKHGKIVPWVYAQSNSEVCVKVLAEEIFLMGKTSALQFKPRYFLWLLTQLPGINPELFWREDALLPLTQRQARFIREFGPLKTRKISPWTTPQEKLAYFNRFYRMLFPGRSWQAYSGMDAYLDPGLNAKWRCLEVVGRCHQCALAAECPSRIEDFGMSNK